MTARERLTSLDVFRGITIAGMIMVNNHGGKCVYPPLEHAEWHGLTLADMIFPFFMFIMGMALTLSFSNRVERGIEKKEIIRRILKRSALLFLFGFIGNFNPGRGLETWRIMGVLQRIGLVYLIASFIVLNFNLKGRAAFAVGLTALYWLLMKTVPVPGFGPGDLSQQGNLAAYVDNLLMRGHLYRPAWDPEGLLHTLPTVSTCLIGVLVGHLVKSTRSLGDKSAYLVVVGAASAALGFFVLDRFFPINKNLWSPSYVVFTGGAAMALFGATLWTVDLKKIRFWNPPFIYLGTNSLLVYMVSGAFYGIASLIPSPESGSEHFRAWFVQRFFVSWAGPCNGSLAFSLFYVAVWICVMGVFYRKKWFVKL